MKTIFKKTTYLGFDGILYPAKAELTIEDDGTRYISLYDYYDAGNWINTEERDWTEEEINYLFKTKEKKMKKETIFLKIEIPKTNTECEEIRESGLFFENIAEALFLDRDNIIEIDETNHLKICEEINKNKGELK